jgi:prepilin signal peptidase PulO-like enzyme (type II secretory pathway)
MHAIEVAGAAVPFVGGVLVVLLPMLMDAVFGVFSGALVFVVVSWLTKLRKNV